MKKLLSFLSIILLLISLPSLTEATETKVYPKKVNVSVHISKELSLTLTGNYQLVNKDTSEKRVIPSPTTLSIKHDGSKVIVTYSGITLNSTKGFDIQELNVASKMAIFTSNTDMRKGASTSYDLVKTFTAGSSADYLATFVNSETWYRVTSGNYTGWVNAKTVKLTDVYKTSLGKINTGTSYRGSFFLKPNGSQVEIINILDMEDYLKGVVPSEMPASWHKEALKAQAIAARSYASNMIMLTTTAASQVYRGYNGEDSRTNIAIQETEGLLAKYDTDGDGDKEPIQAFFHSTSGGRTANVGDVWNSNQKYFPYLVSVDDPYESSWYSNWQEEYPTAVILKSFGFVSTVKLYNIILETNGANKEVTAVTVKTSSGDKTIRGNEGVIRKLFPLQSQAHYNSLYSNWFSLKATKAQADLSVQMTEGTLPITEIKGQKVMTPNGEVTLTDAEVSIQTAAGVITNTDGNGEITSVTLNGKGWGHRIGMSQYGAKGFAEHGWKAEDIIEHYYKGTVVSK